MPFNIRTDLRVQYFDPGTVSYVSIEADTFEVNIERGIDVEQNVFARPKVGICEVKLSKKSLYDLLNATGPAYKSNYTFRVQYKNAGGSWLSIFEGIIQNFEMQYNSDSKRLDITITANDLMKVGLNTNIASFPINSGSRSYKNVMSQLATAINGVDSRFVMTQAGTTGASTFQRIDNPIDTNSGDLFARFMDAELGWLWVDKNNNIKYMTRADVTALQATAWDPLFTTTVSNVHSTAGTHVCMDYMNLSYKSDDIANIVRVVNPMTGTKATVTNSTSVTNFGRQLGEFEVDFDNAASGGTNYNQWATEVSNAATPRRLSGVSVPVILDSGEVSAIAASDIGTVLQVEFASTGFTTMQEVTIISGMNHNITADHWECNVSLWEGV